MKTSRISRIVQLLTLLQSGESHSVEDLTGLLEVSRRTLFRDLNELESIGVPYYFDNQVGGYRLDPDFFLPSINLNLQEALSILMLIRKGSEGSAPSPPHEQESKTSEPDEFLNGQLFEAVNRNNQLFLLR